MLAKSGIFKPQPPPSWRWRVVGKCSCWTAHGLYVQGHDIIPPENESVGPKVQTHKKKPLSTICWAGESDFKIDLYFACPFQ